MIKIKKETKAIIATLVVMILWGSLFPMVKLGFKAYDVSTTGDILLFAGIRFAVCGIIINLFSLLTKRKFIPAFKNVVPVLSSGVFAIILHYAFTYLALSMTDGSKTAILKQIGVLFYVCFSAFFFKDDKITLPKIIGVILGFVGIIAINSGAGGLSFNVGDAFIIAASFCTVFSNIISKKVFKEVDPVVSTGISQLFGGAVLLVVGLLMGGSVSLAHSYWIFIYIILASTISYCMWFTIVKSAELSKLFIIKFAEPVFASVFSAFLLSENILRWQYLAAFVLITAGISVSNFEKKQA